MYNILISKKFRLQGQRSNPLCQRRSQSKEGCI